MGQCQQFPRLLSDDAPYDYEIERDNIHTKLINFYPYGINANTMCKYKPMLMKVQIYCECELWKDKFQDNLFGCLFIINK